MIIAEDAWAASAALPSEWGVDDIPLTLQRLAVDTSGDIKYAITGRLTAGLTYPVLCDGTNIDATTLGFTAPKRRTRFRVLNASPADILTVQRVDGGTYDFLTSRRTPPTPRPTCPARSTRSPGTT